MKIDDVIKAKFMSPQHKALVNLRYTSNFLSNIQQGFMAKYDLSMPQFNILRILRGTDVPLNVNMIKERMVEKSPNTTRLMDKLMEKGLIERVRCNEDRRVVYLSITDDGMELLTQIDKAISISDFMQANLSDEEATLLSDLLDKLRESYA